MITAIFSELGTGAFFGHSFCRGHRLVVNIFFVSDVASVARNLYDSARAKFLHLCCPHASVRTPFFSESRPSTKAILPYRRFARKVLFLFLRR